ncbi:AMMECR1 domain-containing protein, partial [Paraphysoderma sedebokerense]
ATPYHCHFCFDVLSSHLNGQDPIDPPFEDDEYPLFVTWNIKRNGTLRLRGCIGNFTPLPLHSGLKEYALTSAFGDRRFSPITGRELTQLSCGVSLLTEFEDAEDYLDWELGTHGMYITFRDPYTNHKRTATYLPDVPPSQGWTKVETIDSLVAKAGYYGRIDDDLRENISLRRYQSSKCEVDWNEYVVWK